MKQINVVLADTKLEAVFSIKGSEVSVIAIVLEWLPHKEYERRFGYK